jgi:hypothetical protein
LGEEKALLVLSVARPAPNTFKGLPQPLHPDAPSDTSESSGVGVGREEGDRRIFGTARAARMKKYHR